MKSAAAIVLGAAALMTLSIWAATAPAAVAPASTDPTSGSPSGTIYQLPVDNGRRDAAPRPPSSSGSENETLPSTYRSENNFGTSSTVPGLSKQGEAGGKGTGGSDSGNGTVGDLASAGADTGDPSEPLNFLLLALIVVVGAVLGLGASRASRNASR
jgi:hypothetical protein